MEEIPEHCDIVKAVAGRHVNAPHILKSIFGHLDFESLQNAEEVSDDWRSIIMESKTWTHLLSKNVKFHSNWAKASALYNNINPKENLTQTTDRDKCCKLFNLLKCLSQQIRGGFSLPSLAFSVTFPRNDERIMNYSLYSFTDVFWLNEEYIGRGCIDGSIVLWGRWVNELKGVYKPGPANIKHSTSLQFNKDVLVAGFDDGYVHAWNIHTQESTFTFYDDELERMGYLATSYDVALGSGSKYGYLLTCTLAHGEACSQVVLSSWRFDSNRQSFDLLKKIFLEGEIALLDRFFVDETRTVLILTTIYDETEVQFRSTHTLETIKTVTLPVRFVDDVILDSGLLLEGSCSPIRLWDMESGKCVESYQTKAPATSCMFLLNEYIAAIDYSGMLSAWEIGRSENKTEPEDLKEKPPLWSIPTGFNAKRRRYKILLGGDAFHICLFIHGSTLTSPNDRAQLSAESYVMHVMETFRPSLCNIIT